MSSSQEKIYWTQHAPIDRRKGEIVGSGIDRDINREGVKFAHALGRGVLNLAQKGELSDWGRLIISSPLRRATSTSEIVASYIDCKVEIDDRLRAQHFGDLEGMTFEEASSHPVLARHLHENLSDEELDSDKAPGGESIAEALARISEARSDHMDEDRRPLIITHGSMLNHIIGETLELSTVERKDINKRFKGSLILDQKNNSELKSIHFNN